MKHLASILVFASGTNHGFVWAEMVWVDFFCMQWILFCLLSDMSTCPKGSREASLRRYYHEERSQTPGNKNIWGRWWAWDEPFSVCQEHCCLCSWGDPSLTLCTSCPGAQRNPWKAHIGISVTWQSIIVVNSTCKERYDLQYVGIGVPAK